MDITKELLRMAKSVLVAKSMEHKTSQVTLSGGAFKDEATERQFQKDAKAFHKYLKEFDPELLELFLESKKRKVFLNKGGERIWDRTFKKEYGYFVDGLNNRDKLLAIVPKKLLKMTKAIKGDSTIKTFLDMLEGKRSQFMPISIDGKLAGVPKANVLFVNEDPGHRPSYQPIKKLKIDGNDYYFGDQGEVDSRITRGT
jgi:hypothetical protein